jgi:hypothetical protein
MGEAYECDRCGGLNSGSPHTALTVEEGYARSVYRENRKRSEGDIKPKHIDLCRGCLNDLRKWYQEAGGDPGDIEYED